MSDEERSWFVKEGDHRHHHYKFTGDLKLCKGMTLDVEGEELIETDVHWLVRTKNKYDYHAPKQLYRKVD